MYRFVSLDEGWCIDYSKSYRFISSEEVIPGVTHYCWHKHGMFCDRRMSKMKQPN